MAEPNQHEAARRRIEELEKALDQYRGSEAALLQARNDVEKRFEQLVLVQEFSRTALQCHSMELLFECCLESAVAILGLEVGILWRTEEPRTYNAVEFCNADGTLPALIAKDLPCQMEAGCICIGPAPDTWCGMVAPGISEVLWLPLGLPGETNRLLLTLGIPEEKVPFYPPIRDVDMAICRMFQQQAGAVYAYFHELQQRKMSDLAAQKSAAFYRSLFEDSPLPVVELDMANVRNQLIDLEAPPTRRQVMKALRHSQLVRANKAAWEFYGGATWDDIVAYIRKTSATMIARHIEMGRSALMDGERCTWHGQQSTHRGLREVQFYMSALPSFGEGSARMLVAMLDVTDIHAAELAREAFEKRMKRSEKMEALGLLAGGVAHDLNNVLGSVVGFPDLLMEELQNQPEAYEMAEMIRDAGIQASAFVQDLLTMARQGLQAQDRLDVNDVVRAYLKSGPAQQVASAHPEVELEVELAPETLIVGSAIHLGKLVMNLVVNGYEAISGPGRIIIRSELVTLEEDLLGYEKIEAGQYVRLRFEDTGSGIAASHLPHIFEPFYSRKTLGQTSGTGLGMAVVWGVLRDHNAHIDVNTEVGRGTIFCVYIPLAATAESPPANTSVPPTASESNEMILVVDDIPEQRKFLRRVLERYGYQVHSVASGEEAVDWLRDHHADMVLLDMIMDPGIDGLVTYERISAFKPSQAAILVSGYAATERVQSALRLGVRDLIQKPYRPIELITTLQHELKQTSGSS